MTTQEMRKHIITSFLKPRLKEQGFLTSGQTWWKPRGDFFIVINMQNSQWNNLDEIHFCFNIGIALTANLKDPQKKKATYFDLSVNVRESSYLPVERNDGKHRDANWYVLKDNTKLDDFISDIKSDFEGYILPALDTLHTLEDCLEFYRPFPFWGESLQLQVEALSQTK